MGVCSSSRPPLDGVRRERRLVVSTVCRVAQPLSVSHTAPSGSSSERAESAFTGRPAVERPQAPLHHPLDQHLVRREERLAPRLARARGSPRAARSPTRCACSRSASAPGRATTTSTMSRPSGSAESSAARTSSGSHGRVMPISRYSASLAAPVGDALAYEILGCGREARRVADRDRRRAGSPARTPGRSRGGW